MQTASQNYISQMETEESELEKSVSLIEKHLQQLDFLTKNTAVFNVKWTFFMPCEISWKSEDVFALLDAISSGMTLSHERWSSDMQRRQQITSCWLQKKSIMKSGWFEHFVCVVSTSSDKVDITSMWMT
jgi:hypothetical protein